MSHSTCLRKFAIAIYFPSNCYEMHITQIINAVTMVSPLICLWRNRKKKSVFKKVLCVHIPLSMCYHLSCAFPVSLKWAITTLKTLDYTFIHMLSLASRIDFKRYHNIHFSALGHTCLIMTSIRKRDPALAKFGLMVFDHLHFRRIEPELAKRALKAGTITFTFYFYDKHIPIGHGIFHITLYWLFDIYFKMLDKTI